MKAPLLKYEPNMEIRKSMESTTELLKIIRDSDAMLKAMTDEEMQVIADFTRDSVEDHRVMYQLAITVRDVAEEIAAKRKEYSSDPTGTETDRPGVDQN